MALTTLELKKQLDQMFSGSQWKTSFKRDQDKYRVEWRETGKGVNITLPNVIANHKQQGDKAIKELVYHVKMSLEMMHQEVKLRSEERRVGKECRDQK